MNQHNRFDPLITQQQPIAVIGLGYVGLPLAVCLAKQFRVIGFDLKGERLARLRVGYDDTGEITQASLLASGIIFTGDATELQRASFIIVAVPTPVDQAKQPDFAPLQAACRTVGQQLRCGATVVFESTVYPGATEEICIPLIEQVSGLHAGRDFFFGYSPERINPGDTEHTIEKIKKVVSGCDQDTLELIAQVYATVIPVGVHRAPSIRVAEAAKVIENTQRDVNIALINEIALICHRLHIDTLDVLQAAGTKWNFLPFRPGLVGGHCIGVDPYYLTYKAAELNYHPDVILAGRRINDSMGFFVARECIRLLIAGNLPVKNARVLILGFTFKENVPDVRGTKVIDIVHELRHFGADPIVCDPLADAREVEQQFALELTPFSPLPSADAVIIAVAHRQIAALTVSELVAVLKAGAPCLDVKGMFSREALSKAGLIPWRL
jgi:UDP-N-acetyl-D-glucosamine/UDP-N-acetyl-D-galactosamine dehydrogenase